MAKLNLTTSDDLAATDNYRVFLYGDNRSGKTYFSATWPLPLFLVPNIAANEMRSLKGMGIPVVTFGAIEDCREQVCKVADLIAKGKPVGPYVPRTIVIDNLTSMLEAWKDELKKPGEDKLDWEGWGKLASTINGMMAALHTIDTHTIWIAHSRIQTTKSKGPSGRIEETDVGTYTIQGSAKNTIPSHCDLLLYTEAMETLKGPSWWIYTQKKGIWPAGIRAGSDHDLPKRIGPKPHYEDFAEALGLPMLDEAEK
jgi:hypothetical protein